MIILFAGRKADWYYNTETGESHTKPVPPQPAPDPWLSRRFFDAVPIGMCMLCGSYITDPQAKRALTAESFDTEPISPSGLVCAECARGDV